MIVTFTEVWYDEPHPEVFFYVEPNSIRLALPIWHRLEGLVAGQHRFEVLSPPLDLRRFCSHFERVLDGPTVGDWKRELMQTGTPLEGDPELDYMDGDFRLRAIRTALGSILLRVEGNTAAREELADVLRGHAELRGLAPSYTWFSFETAFAMVRTLGQMAAIVTERGMA